MYLITYCCGCSRIFENGYNTYFVISLIAMILQADKKAADIKAKEEAKRKAEEEALKKAEEEAAAAAAAAAAEEEEEIDYDAD